MISWGRKRAGWWVAMVLPGFLLRALIPLGFMPMFGPGHSVQLALCEDYAPVASMTVDTPADTSADMTMTMAMPMDMSMVTPAGSHKSHAPGTESGRAGRHPPAHQDHGTCPYGASPTLAALALASTPDVAEQPAWHAALAAPQIAHAEIAPRAQSPRGPPQPV